MLRISRKFGCGLALALLIPVGGAHAKSRETVLYSFTGGADGGNPFAGLIEDKSGNFYGTTVEGGADGDGTVFKLAPNGTKTVLLSFTGADGSGPQAGLIMDKKGNLYGTTVFGGAHNGGTVFEVAPDGTETVLYSFKGGTDGTFPEAGLIMDRKGNLYGTTDEGGAPVDYGTVFRLAPDGTETVLYEFKGGSDGAFPVAALVADSAGNLYGTTAAEGAGGNGIVFEVAPDGAETVLLSFTGADGAAPQAGLIMSKKGKLYGTTLFGGANDFGTVFKFASDGTETVLYSFDSAVNGADGFEPYAGVIEDESGNLYGTTYGGGPDGGGTVFKISKH
jgi:uncharacterized repeat protein (TIGR03803 family)